LTDREGENLHFFKVQTVIGSDDLRAWAAQLRSISRDCFDMTAAAHLRLLATELEEKARSCRQR
jgi:hypothetical protein